MSEKEVQPAEADATYGTVVGAMEILSWYARRCGGCGGAGVVKGPELFGPDARMTCPACNGAREVRMDFAMLQALGMGKVQECDECHETAWCADVPDVHPDGSPGAACAACWIEMFPEEEAE